MRIRSQDKSYKVRKIVAVCLREIDYEKIPTAFSNKIFTLVKSMIAENEKDVQLDIIEILINMLKSKALSNEFSEL